MAVSVYLLCLLTSAFCAALLWREYLRTRARLRLWSSLSFVGWAANNAMMFADLVVFPGIDLSLVRSVLALVAITLLLSGLIGEAA